MVERATESTTDSKMADTMHHNKIDTTSTAAPPCAADLANVVTPKEDDLNPL
jgi:hypothetical protein